MKRDLLELGFDISLGTLEQYMAFMKRLLSIEERGRNP